jgi:hypothetical protein
MFVLLVMVRGHFTGRMPIHPITSAYDAMNSCDFRLASAVLTLVIIANSDPPASTSTAGNLLINNAGIQHVAPVDEMQAD